MSEGLKLVPDGAPCSLQDCPPGPFAFGDTLGFKTEYGGKWPEPFCLGTGESFWGGTHDIEARAALIVQPLSLGTPKATPERAGREVSPEAVVCDSADYKREFYGILNAQGRFWTPLAFADEGYAHEWLEAFVAKDRERFGDMLTTHKVVPVRIQLSAILGLRSMGVGAAS